LTAFVGTMCIFACFSAAAMFAEGRTRMYLAGWLSSGLTVLFWLGLANFFFRSGFLLNIQLYGGLFVFVGFVVYDTQLIIEKANNGQKDFVRHALELFLGKTSSNFHSLSLSLSL
jgi:Bax inhibitor 1